MIGDFGRFWYSSNALIPSRAAVAAPATAKPMTIGVDFRESLASSYVSIQSL
jgi:hypothetical protein